MGTYKNGILGAFKGKVGNVVGSTWNGIPYMRAIPANVKDAKTPKQLAQRQRFSIMTSFLRRFKAAISIGFKYGAGNMAPANRAMSYNIKNAIGGEYPDLEIQFENLRFSRGDLIGLYQPEAVSDEPGKLLLSWTDNTSDGSALPDDNLVVVCYSPDRDAVYQFLEAAAREDESVEIILPEPWQGEVAETYAFFISSDGKEVSDTTYLGAIQINEAP
ncbi:DUF6266 family protein [Rhodohalobacter halophilus]|uniref:DUF6266 family protein n=1 Tax=Rhodohalobacter halophilus TaxID=1812810 RepID=UPI00083F87E6|nr:DUF6266 family protein [Rhodohalobacter halophilus]